MAVAQAVAVAPAEAVAQAAEEAQAVAEGTGGGGVAHRIRPAAARLTGDLRTGGRTTRSPVHGCLPPPSKGGNRGPGRGRTPPQHTILRWNQQLPNRVYLSQSSIFNSSSFS